MKSLSRVRLPATPWTAAYQAPPSMGFSRQEYWSGVPLPSPPRPLAFLIFSKVKQLPNILGQRIVHEYETIYVMLLLSHFSHVWLYVTPWTAAYQAPPSLGFSRQEHWSGLPLPSPMHESEKRKLSHSVMSDSSRPHGLQPTRLLHPWDFPGKSTGVGCHCLLWYML